MVLLYGIEPGVIRWRHECGERFHRYCVQWLRLRGGGYRLSDCELNDLWDEFERLGLNE